MTLSWILLALFDSRYRPKFSWILLSMLGFLGVMFFANLFGEYPLKSFWSNYERMDGYVTLVHFFLYFIVTSAMLTVEKHWNWFFNTTLSIAVLVCFYAFAQISGAIEISQGGSWRVDSTLGNSTYMAVYMLFHVFIAALMFTRSASRNRKIVHGLLIALFTFILFQTGTRGAILGLIGGGLLTASYLTIFATAYPRMRKAGAGILFALILLVAGFVVIRDAAFIQNMPMFDRLADISLKSGDIRFMVWSVALEGIKERPILGWGQENFSYVFNAYYDPGLHIAEAWYDRTHNVVFDWLIAGGILGALAYFSIFIATLFYTVVRPIVNRFRKRKEDATFTVMERALLLGLLGAYVFHNLFVFDNIVSYIFFAVILAFIHTRVAVDIRFIKEFRIDPMFVSRIAVPVGGVLLAATIYFVNVPAMRAAGDIIDSFRSQNIDTRMEEFQQALDRDSFGRQEIVEQLVQQAMTLQDQESIPASEKREFATFAEKELLAMIEEKPNDPRFYIFLAGLYRAQGEAAQAAEALAGARALTPTKPSIIVEQGVLEYQRMNFDAMARFFKETYELAPNFERGRILYGGSLLYTGETERFAEVLTEPYMLAFADSSAPFLAIGKAEHIAALDRYFESYLDAHPESTIARTAYAQILQIRGEKTEALGLIEEGVALDPAFGSVGNCFVTNLEANRPMREPCN